VKKLEAPRSIDFTRDETKLIREGLLLMLPHHNVDDIDTRLREVNNCLKYFSIDAARIIGTHHDIFVKLFFSK
jgi:hypothetical protein